MNIKSPIVQALIFLFSFCLKEKYTNIIAKKPKAAAKYLCTTSGMALRMGLI